METTNATYDKYIGVFNNKRVIVLACVPTSVPEETQQNIERGLLEAVAGCNERSPETPLLLTMLEEEGSLIYSVMVDHECRYTDEEVKSYIFLQAVNIIGFLGKVLQKRKKNEKRA